MNSTICSPGADAYFGPAVNPHCRGGFDFTIVFEQFLILIPTSLLILVSPLRLWYLHKRPTRVMGPALRSVKLATISVFALLQLALICLWATRSGPSPVNRVALAAASVSFASSVMSLLLSYAEHSRSPRPSSLLNMFLLVSFLLDMAVVRTVWLSSFIGGGLKGVYTASFVAKAAMLALEAVQKGSHLVNPEAFDCSPELTAGLYARAVFAWLAPLLVAGFKKLLRPQDLFVLDDDMDPGKISDAFWKHWDHYGVDRSSQYQSSCSPALVESQAAGLPGNEPTGPAQHTSSAQPSPKEEKQSHRPWRLMLCCVLSLKWSLLRIVPPRLFLVAFSLCQPLLVNRFLEFLADESQPVDIGYGLIAAYGLVYLGIAFSQALYWHRNGRSLSMLRALLVSAVFAKLTDVKAAEDAASVTLMSSDVDVIIRATKQVHEFWANLIQIAIATWLLSTQIGFAAVGPIIVALFALIVTVMTAPMAKKTQVAWLSKTQKRIGITSALVGNIKSIKSSGLSAKLSQTIAALRAEEIAASRPFRVLGAVTSAVAQVPMLLSPVVAFALFQLVTRTTGQVLDATGLFAALSLVFLTAQPLFWMFEVVLDMAAAFGAFERIQRFLLTEGRREYRQLGDTRGSDHVSIPIRGKLVANELPNLEARKGHISENIDIHVQGTAFAWTAERKILDQVSFLVKKGQMVMLVGSVASGKTTLLKGLLGEVPHTTGQVFVRERLVSWCDQSPWILNQSIRDNILGYAPFDEALYDQVVRACELDADFDALPEGDMTLVGSKGLALSGGQKQRIALARAVYARPRIALFDDIFSGLDNHTASLIFARLFGSGGLLRKWKTTIVLATQSVRFLSSADWIISLQESSISEQGTFENLRTSSGYVQSLMIHNQLSPSTNSSSVVINDENSQVVARARKQHQAKESAATANDSRRQTGDSSVYKYYFSSIGIIHVVVLLVLEVGWAFLESFPTVWLKFWADADANDTGENAGFYLGIYAVFQISGAIWFAALVGFVLIFIAAKSGITLHNRLLYTVARAPLSLFTKTDLGVITTRFSQDIGIIDNQLPLGLIVAIASFFAVIAKAALLASSSYFTALAFPFLAFLYYHLQRAYLRTSRQLRLLDLEQKAPLYTQFLETLSGLATVRAFGWRSACLVKNHDLVSASQRPFYLLVMVQRWLVLALDLTTAALALLVVGFSVMLRGKVSVSLTGVSLVQLISMSETLNTLIQFWTSIETSISAVVRIKHFAEETPDENLPGEVGEPPASWPNRGHVVLDHVTASYGEDSEFKALDDISLEVRPGEKVGICGRTGSGKSSLLLTLLRLLKPSSGNITIDSQPLTSLPRETIRSRLISISQDQFLLPGTVRQNLDPFEAAASDESMKQALEAVGLLESLEGGGGLDAEFKLDMLSHGQRQLFFLARAVLRKSVGKVVLLDEATSSVDQKCEQMVQQVIKTQFKDHTVIAIAHRLDTILDFDRVVLLDKGRVVEEGKPQDLLEKGGKFKALWDASQNVSH